VRLGGAAVTLSGELTGLKGKTTADLRAVASKVQLAEVAPILSLFGPLLPAGLAMKGTIAIDVSARGAIDDPLKMAIRGTATVSGFEFSDPSLKEPVREIAATLKLIGDRAELTGLAASLGRSRVRGACTISRFARPVLDVDLTAPLLDVDEILSFLPAEGAVPLRARRAAATCPHRKPVTAASQGRSTAAKPACVLKAVKPGCAPKAAPVGAQAR